MDIQPADIAIFLISFAACAYCIVLSRRLKALQNTKDGLGATIMALSNSIAAMSSTTKETGTYAGELATRLARLMKDAEATCGKIERFTSDTGAHAELESTMNRALAEAKAKAADFAAQQFAAPLQDAEAVCKNVENLTSEIEQKHIQLQADVTAAQAELEAMMRHTLAESQAKITEMTALASQMKSLTERTTDVIQRAIRETPAPEFKPLAEAARNQ